MINSATQMDYVKSSQEQKKYFKNYMMVFRKVIWSKNVNPISLNSQEPEEIKKTAKYI
jgi:hypothetical protein